MLPQDTRKNYPKIATKSLKNLKGLATGYYPYLAVIHSTVIMALRARYGMLRRRPLAAMTVTITQRAPIGGICVLMMSIHPFVHPLRIPTSQIIVLVAPAT